MFKVKSIVAVLALGCLASAAQADTLPAGPITLLDHTQLVGGAFSTVLDFLAPAAGTVSVTLSDLGWPQALSSLSFAATDVHHILSSLSGAGSASFDVGGAGHFFAIISGQTQGSLDLGLYSLNLHWTSLSSAASVPLPAAGWLLVSGVGGLLGFARRRREEAKV